MRSPERRYKSFWLSCLLFLVFGGPACAGMSAEITGVKFEPDQKRIIIDSKGKVGKHLARVIGRPNRLVMDFENTRVGRLQGKIPVGQENIKEIRVGSASSRARVVVDFHDQPVPPFHVRRSDEQILVLFGNGLNASNGSNPAAPNAVSTKMQSYLDPKLVPAAAPVPPRSGGIGLAIQPSTAAGRPVQPAGMAGPQPSAAAPKTVKTNTGWTVGTWGTKPATANVSSMRPPMPPNVRVAQSMDMNRPSSSLGNRGRSVPTPPALAGNGNSFPSSGSAAGGAVGMPREVRPPVTPPTPDPRLLVQEVTELKFIQVGHNSRLIIQGGDHLDYRLNKVSPTKLRIDLINAEIPKVHQKPLRTDQFSTSVEMIIPGSQTIFVQLKDHVPYQVEKKKGILMVDFPPPRFALTADQKKAAGAQAGPSPDLARREAAREARERQRRARAIVREEEIVKENEMRRRAISSLQKQQEELEKQRTEILKRYRVTPDPEIFSKKVSMDFQGISLKNAFRLLAEQAGVNIIVDDKVTGSTTVRLFQVPLGQVIDTILNSHGLDREMVGNVMRIGKSEDIATLKKARLVEYEKRMNEVTRRIREITEEIREKQKEIETASNEIKKLTEVEREEAPVEEVKVEEIGEAGCARIQGQEVCFFFTVVKLVYLAPKDLIPTLECMFNLNCRGIQKSVAEKREEAQASYADQLKEQGFLEPALRARMQTQQKTDSAVTRAESSVQQVQAISQIGPRPLVVERETPTFLAELTKHTMLWGDEKFNRIFIKDTAERIAQMKKVIYSLDVPTPQVTIEGRLVEATREMGRSLGIIWGGRGNQVGPYKNTRSGYWGIAGIEDGARTPTGTETAGDNIPSSFAVNLPATTVGDVNLVGLAAQFGLLATETITELDLRLSMGEAQNKLKTIGRPKVTVINKQKASIKYGKQIPYITTSADGVQTQLINADLLLDVTPEIFPDGRIKMTIKFTNNEPDSPGANPVITTREANTTMTVKDGQTAVIGGIVRERDTDRRGGWPGLMNVPVINMLFSNKSVENSLNELLVFITPAIVKRPPAAS